MRMKLHHQPLACSKSEQPLVHWSNMGEGVPDNDTMPVRPGCLEVKMVHGRRTVLANRREDKRKREAPSTTLGGKRAWHGHS